MQDLAHSHIGGWAWHTCLENIAMRITAVTLSYEERVSAFLVTHNPRSLVYGIADSGGHVFCSAEVTPEGHLEAFEPVGERSHASMTWANRLARLVRFHVVKDTWPEEYRRTWMESKAL